jgi:glycosyltransferase involved in cell wall biosynthesis
MRTVSVVIPAYNSEQWIGETLDCILSQTYRNLEIIVVDDGSQDSTGSVAASKLKTFPGRWEIVRQDNKGLPGARNAGFKASHGEWVLFMDSDDLLHPETITRLMSSAESAAENVAVVYGPWQRFAGDGDRRKRLEEPQSPIIDNDKAASHLAPKNCVLVPGSLVRRTWLDKIEGFDERLRVSAEDLDFIVRIALAGGRFEFVDAEEPFLLWRMFPDRPRLGDSGGRYPVVHGAFVWLSCLQKTCPAGTLKSAGLSPQDEHGIIGYARWRMKLILDHGYRSEFNDFARAMRQLVPDFVPRHPRSLWVLSQLVGYSTASLIDGNVRAWFTRRKARGLAAP